MLIHDPTVRDHFGEMRGLLRQLDDAFRGVDRPRGELGNSAWPRIELEDAGDELVLRADVPGLGEEDISIDATAQGMTIRGERQVPVPEGYTAHRRERSAVRFARSLSFPSRIDLEKVSASVSNGVLTVRAAKQAEERPKQITIQAS